jgi:hypothetical protein
VSSTDPLLGTELAIGVSGTSVTTYQYPAPDGSYHWCDYTEVAAINDSGTIVGNMGMGCGPGHQEAWLLPGGAGFTSRIPIGYVDARTAAVSTRVFTVNNSGSIGGMWIDSHGHEHGYVAERP